MNSTQDVKPDYERIVKRYRKRNLYDIADSDSCAVAFGKTDIECLLPHRDPFLLIDRITDVNLVQETIRGVRYVGDDDPIFRGHFPGQPVYPGVLHLEMIGQLAICYYRFFRKGRIEINNQAPLGVRALKVHHALFQHEIGPGEEVIVTARTLEYDDFTFTGIGQILKPNQEDPAAAYLVCTVAAAAFYIL